jgi:hypothetical protein
MDQAPIWGRLVLEWELRAPLVRIGADPSAEISLAQLSKARELLALRSVHGQVHVEPSGLEHRVMLNGRVITKPTPLRDNDKIGAVGLVFRYEQVS